VCTADSWQAEPCAYFQDSLSADERFVFQQKVGQCKGRWPTKRGPRGVLMDDHLIRWQVKS
jgi:hypothetical protein